MMALLARPWVRLPHLLATYSTIAVGAPLVFFAAYELDVFLHSSKAFGGYFNSPIAVLVIVVIALLVVPSVFTHLTQKDRKQEVPKDEAELFSSMFAAKITSSLAAGVGIGLYLREQNNNALEREYMLNHLRFMIQHAGEIPFTEKELSELQADLERPTSNADPEYRALLAQFIQEKRRAG